MVRRYLFQWFALAALTVSAQPPARFVGTVRDVRAAEIDIQSDQGELCTAKLIAESVFQRVAPGEKDLKKASAIALTDVKVGDRALVALEPGTKDLRRLVVMPAADIQKRNEQDRLDWVKRGLSGTVTSKSGSEIKLKIQSIMSESEATIKVNAQTKYRRYAPDSVKYSDAKASSIAEVSVGDQLRGRGVKSEDGTTVDADEVVFGTFVTRAGKIDVVDADAHTIRILQIGSNKPLLVHIAADSQLKSMPNFGGGGFGGGMPGGMPGGGAPSGGGMPGGQRPQGGSAGPGGFGGPGGPPGEGGFRGPGGPGGGGPGRGGDLSQMLERMPATKLEDLKPGQTVVVSSTKSKSADEVTAIMLLANADMMIQMAQQRAAMAAARQGASGARGGAGGMGGGMDAGGMGGGMEGLQLPGISF